MKLTLPLGLTALLYCLSAPSLAFVLTPANQAPDFAEPWNPPWPSANIALEPTASVSGDAIGLGVESTDTPIPIGGRIVFTLTGGATFADTAYSLESWEAGAGNGNLTYATLLTGSTSGASSIEFLMAEQTNPERDTMFGSPPWPALADVPIFLLSGSSIAGQSINVNLPQIPGRDISLQAEVFDASDASLGTASMVMFSSTLEAPAPAVALPTSSHLGQLILLALFSWLGARAIRQRHP
ncbi:hypothetical protein [Gilvimarinus algae]|uniref:IPTL-CTERM protein sorting domain-containing protein n=1 Tax=Gilvimarinus algae TaxID=3058037 RepID=A0ABT8TCY4_9GAMM|nr:hypothetical protein [Gilvimarinus sp. SDUM040014]MDO3381801.1 hypothetical protein [Gilvimarinus sp. SDUM040014]